MDYVQAFSASSSRRCSALCILGMLWKRATTAGGFWGCWPARVTSIGMWAGCSETLAALRYVAISPDAKAMAEDMYRALWSWLVCVS